MLETASIAGGAIAALIIVFIFGLFVCLKNHQKKCEFEVESQTISHHHHDIIKLPRCQNCQISDQFTIVIKFHSGWKKLCRSFETLQETTKVMSQLKIGPWAAKTSKGLLKKNELMNLNKIIFILFQQIDWDWMPKSSIRIIYCKHKKTWKFSCRNILKTVILEKYSFKVKSKKQCQLNK